MTTPIIQKTPCNHPFTTMENEVLKCSVCRVELKNEVPKTIQERAEAYLKQDFENKFDCYADTDNGLPIMAMTFDAVKELFGKYATEQQSLSEAELNKYKTLYEELDSNQEPLQDRVILSEARIKELEEALSWFVNSCYVGCTKEELNHLRINAEKILNK